ALGRRSASGERLPRAPCWTTQIARRCYCQGFPVPLTDDHPNREEVFSVSVRVWAGTSGYSYPEWKGNFYPEKMTARDMLRFYAGRFPTVEINNTFYRMPREELLAGWAEQVPEGFRFVIKGPKRITHDKRLNEVGEPVAFFLRV